MQAAATPTGALGGGFCYGFAHKPALRRKLHGRGHGEADETSGTGQPSPTCQQTCTLKVHTSSCTAVPRVVRREKDSDRSRPSQRDVDGMNLVQPIHIYCPLHPDCT